MEGCNKKSVVSHHGWGVGNYRYSLTQNVFLYFVASWYFLSWQNSFSWVGLESCWLLALLVAPYPSLAFYIFDEQCTKIKSPHIFTSLAFCPHYHSIFYTKNMWQTTEQTLQAFEVPGTASSSLPLTFHSKLGMFGATYATCYLPCLFDGNLHEAAVATLPRLGFGVERLEGLNCWNTQFEVEKTDTKLVNRN